MHRGDDKRCGALDKGCGVAGYLLNQCIGARLDPIRWGRAGLTFPMATLTSGRKPSARETAAGVFVFLVLGAVLAWLLHTQARFSPAVSIAFQDGGGVAAQAPPPVRLPDLLSSWPAALHPMSPPESFSADTLSDKIDGKAEVYLAAGVAGMKCQRLALPATSSSWIELFVYDMGKPANAFSVFSSQKRADVTDLPLADYAYRAGNQMAFVQGQFYVEIVATDEAPATLDACAALAQAYVIATVVAVHANVSADSALFPKEGLVAGSVSLLSADVFGFDALKDVFVAHYRSGPDEVTLFIARRATASEARAGASALRGFFVDDCGGRESPHPPEPAGAAVIDEGGTFEGIFTSGRYLAGVHQAPDRESAVRWMKRLADRLSQSP